MSLPQSKSQRPHLDRDKETHNHGEGIYYHYYDTVPLDAAISVDLPVSHCVVQ